MSVFVNADREITLGPKLRNTYDIWRMTPSHYFLLLRIFEAMLVAVLSIPVVPLAWQVMAPELPSMALASLWLLTVFAVAAMLGWQTAYSGSVTPSRTRTSISVVLVWALTIGPITLASSDLATDRGLPSHRVFLVFLFGAAVLALTRILLVGATVSFIRNGRVREDVLLVGHPEQISEALIFFAKRPEIKVVGAIFVGVPWVGAHSTPEVHCLQNPDQITEFLRVHRVDSMLIPILSDRSADYEEIMKVISDLPIPAHIIYAPPVLRSNRSTNIMHAIGLAASLRMRRCAKEVHQLPLSAAPLGAAQWVIKDVIDRLLALSALLFLSPLLLFVAVGIKMSSTGPILFRQAREGYRGREFQILKFRTMHHTAATDAPGSFHLTVPKDPRVFPFGAFLRRTSLDELPQLINVLKGDMWLVGPRPHPWLAKAGDKFYRDAVPGYAARQWVKPGITGLAQVNGWRGPTVTTEQIVERVRHDVEYIRNWSIWLDMSIIFRTVTRGLTGTNAF